MAAHYSANQYQSSFNSNTLQNWNIPKPYKEWPSTHEGFTQFIANERGHLLPSVPRSKASPWGTFIGTWDMPTKIPPAKLSLSARSADASKRLIDWIQDSGPLISACNGLRPDITGTVSDQKQEPQEKSPRSAVIPALEAAVKTPPRSSATSPSGSHKANRSSPEGQREEEER